MSTATYPPEAARLLSYGFAEIKRPWPDYVRELGLITEVYLRQRADVTVIHWGQVLDALE